MTPKGQTRDPVRLERNVSKTDGDAITTIANYLVCCEAVRSAILATAWLVVEEDMHEKRFLHFRSQ